MTWARVFYEKNKGWLYFSVFSTFFWGMVAHAYAFFNSNFSGDSLNELHGAIFGNNLRIFSGRIFVPLYRDLLRGDVTLPWLIGLLSLLWLSLAVFLVLRIFRVESKTIAFLIAGVFATNTTISATAATYIHDLDCFMVSLLCAVAAVYLWREIRYGWLWGAPLIAISIGMYQSYVFTGAALVMIASIVALLEGDSWQKVFIKGIKAVAMVLFGGILYYIGLKIIVPISGIQLSSEYYNSMDLITQVKPNEIIPLIRAAYGDWFFRLWEQSSTYPSILVRLMLVGILLSCGISLMVWFCDRKVGKLEKLLCLILLVLLPLVMNFTRVLTLGMNHDLMVFAIWLTYLLALLTTDWLAKRWNHTNLISRWARIQKTVCMTLIAVLMYGNVQLANGLYLKKTWNMMLICR